MMWDVPAPLKLRYFISLLVHDGVSVRDIFCIFWYFAIEGKCLRRGGGWEGRRLKREMSTFFALLSVSTM